MASPTSEPQLSCKQKIIDYIKADERDLAWLSRKTDIPYQTLYAIFIQNIQSLNQERLNLINIACKTNFELDVPDEKIK